MGYKKAIGWVFKLHRIRRYNLIHFDPPHSLQSFKNKMRFTTFTSFIFVAAVCGLVSSAPVPGNFNFPSFAKGGNAQSGNSGNANGGNAENYGWEIINYPGASK